MKYSESHMIGLIATSKFAEFCMKQKPFIIWRENSGIDYGYDGEIEFTTQVNGQYIPSGIIQKVEIKSVSDFSKRSVYLSSAQLDYYIKSNVDVLIVVYARDEDKFYSIYASDIPSRIVNRGGTIQHVRIPHKLFGLLQFDQKRSLPNSHKTKKAIQATSKDSAQLKLISKLENCLTGIDHWREYEEICASIVNYLFQSSFRNFQTIIQARNENGLDIKDLIIPNRSTTPFWQEVRVDYNARNLVFEFKNYSKKIGKNQLVQTSNYLKKKTYGRFGIIFCRKGLSENGLEEQKELLRDDDKLIIVLEDEDLIAILKQKQLGKSAETFLEKLKTELELKI